MNLRTHYHRCDKGSLPADIVEPVIDSIEKLRFRFRHGCSKKLREQILKKLRLSGWSGKVRIAPESRITVTAIRGDVALCLQTGNMSRFYADLLKLEFLHKRGKACAAIYIIPTKARAKEMGSNVACFERFVEEMKLFQEIITIPTLVIGLD